MRKNIFWRLVVAVIILLPGVYCYGSKPKPGRGKGHVQYKQVQHDQTSVKHDQADVKTKKEVSGDNPHVIIENNSLMPVFVFYRTQQDPDHIQILQIPGDSLKGDKGPRVTLGNLRDIYSKS